MATSIQVYIPSSGRHFDFVRLCDMSIEDLRRDLMGVLSVSYSEEVWDGMKNQFEEFEFYTTDNAVVDQKMQLTGMSHATLAFKRRPGRSSSSALRGLYESKCDLRGLQHSYEFSTNFKTNELGTKIETGSLEDCIPILILSSEHASKDNIDVLSFLGALWKHYDPETVIRAIRDSWSEVSSLRGYSLKELSTLFHNFVEQVLVSPYGRPEDETFRSLIGDLLVELYGRGDKEMLLLNRGPRKPSTHNFELCTDELTLLPTLSGDQRHLAPFNIIYVEIGKICEQMIVDEASLFSLLRIEELWGLQWQKDASKSPTVTAISHRFSRITDWVTLVMLTRSSTKEFVVAYKRFAKLLSLLLAKRAYNSAAQVAFGLTASNLTRCKSVMEKVPDKVKSGVKKVAGLFDGKKNFEAYRGLDHTSPMIPFIAVYQRDLVYIHENRSKEVVFCKSILDMASIRQEGEIIFGMNLHIPSTTDYTDIARANPQLGEAFAAIPRATDDAIYEFSTTVCPIKGSFTPVSMTRATEILDIPLSAVLPCGQEGATVVSNPSCRSPSPSSQTLVAGPAPDRMEMPCEQDLGVGDLVSELEGFLPEGGESEPLQAPAPVVPLSPRSCAFRTPTSPETARRTAKLRKQGKEQETLLTIITAQQKAISVLCQQLADLSASKVEPAIPGNLIVEAGMGLGEVNRAIRDFCDLPTRAEFDDMAAKVEVLTREVSALKDKNKKLKKRISRSSLSSKSPRKSRSGSRVKSATGDEIGERTTYRSAVFYQGAEPAGGDAARSKSSFE